MKRAAHHQMCTSVVTHWYSIGFSGVLVDRFLLFYDLPLVGAIAALAWVLIRRRFTLLRPGRAGAFAIVAAIVIIGLRLSELGFTPLVELVGVFPDQVLGRFLVPLLLGILGCLILLFTPPLGPRGVADLTRRSMLRSGPRSSFVTVAAILALMIVFSLWAGSLSSPDEDGRYRMFTIEPGESLAAGTNIFGWFYSLRGLPIVVLLIALCLWRLRNIARGPGDEADRWSANRAVLAITAGALLFGLAEIIMSLQAAASIRFYAETFNFQSSLAALELPLRWAVRAVIAMAWASWFSVLFSPAPRRAKHSRTDSPNAFSPVGPTQ